MQKYKSVLKLVNTSQTANWNRFGTSAKMKGKLISINDPKAVRQAADLLTSGEVIALPTDTVYGLACDANDPKAIERLYNIKGRHELKPVAICVGTVRELRLWGQADHVPDSLLNSLLPGAVTIVLKKSTKLNNPQLNPGTTNIGIRITENKFIQDVCETFNKPIALTSANKSASKSTLNVQEFKTLWSQLGAVFDGGQLGQSEEQRAASTVIDLSEPEYYMIIRSGVAAHRTIQILERAGLYVKV